MDDLLHLNPVMYTLKLLWGLSLAVAVYDRLGESTGYTRVIKQHLVGDDPHVGSKRRVLLERFVDGI